MKQTALFELPIRANDDADHVVGSIVCTAAAPKVYLVTFASPPDNRLVTNFCRTLMLALDIIEHKYPAGVVITTSALAKFYSNGMDIAHSQWSRDYFPAALYALWRRVLTFPMPTLALCNGHAFAGGFMLAMMHDYRVMNPHRGWLCLNEIELGMPLRAPMMAVFKAKVGEGNLLRKVVLEGHRFAALEALKDGLVDHVGGLEETVAFVGEMRLVQKAQPGQSGLSSYGELKRGLWSEVVECLDDWTGDSVRPWQMKNEIRREREESLKKVKEWERVSGLGKAKL